MNRPPTSENMVTQSSERDQHKTIHSDFIKEIEGKEFVTYQGLLDLAHQKGLNRLTVEVLQHPCAANGETAVILATAVTVNGEHFSDVGDANPGNCNAKVARHLLRMASTRAKARALRDLTNIGMTCLDELEINQPEEYSTAQRQPQAKSIHRQEGQSHLQRPKRQGDVFHLSDAQKRAIFNLARRSKLNEEQLQAKSVEMFGVQVEQLSRSDASSMIQHLQQAA